MFDISFAANFVGSLVKIASDFEDSVQKGLDDGAEKIVEAKHAAQQEIYDRGPAPGAKPHTRNLYNDVKIESQGDTRIIGNRGASEAYEERNTNLPPSPRDGINRTNKAAEVASVEGETPALDAISLRISDALPP